MHGKLSNHTTLSSMVATIMPRVTLSTTGAPDCKNRMYTEVSKDSRVKYRYSTAKKVNDTPTSFPTARHSQPGPKLRPVSSGLLRASSAISKQPRSSNSLPGAEHPSTTGFLPSTCSPSKVSHSIFNLVKYHKLLRKQIFFHIFAVRFLPQI